MPFDREHVKAKAAELAARGVYIGTSSWKYAGWLGQLYSPQRYEYRGKVAKTRFERDCLTEYSEVFKTVCVDAAYYDFPRTENLRRLADQTPDDFKFGFKVTDALTIKKFPNLPRFGSKAGLANPDFLNADLFATAFLKPCETIRQKIGVLMFEFSRFWSTDYEHGRDFIANLDAFLGAIPSGWPYAIEMRNAKWLREEYLHCLARHGVSHVFNSWSAMPSITEQLALPGTRTNPGLVAARFLLKPGRTFEQAVKMFQPYDKTREFNDDEREAGRVLIVEGVRYEPRRKTYIYVNNRLEGNALETIAAMLEWESTVEPLVDDQTPA
ncbi:MAG TPA: DUF72 domain-containing protein [Verrucomicrobiae bacterium]|nr:DUF72 domain-containing protein [Verrucomicrobiae bacterium]